MLNSSHTGWPAAASAASSCRWPLAVAQTEYFRLLWASSSLKHCGEESAGAYTGKRRESEVK
jgi:hypothetical protein